MFVVNHAVTTGNKYAPIKEEEEEDSIAEQDEVEEYLEWLEMQDQSTISAYQAMDDLKDAEDELEELRAAASEEDYWNSLEDEGAQPRDSEVKVEKLLKGAAQEGEVVKCLSSCCSEQLDYDSMPHLEKIDFHKNKTFAAMFEQLQERRMQDEMLRAHAANGGNTLHAIPSGPNNPSPGEPSGVNRELDF